MLLLRKSTTAIAANWAETGEEEASGASATKAEEEEEREGAREEKKGITSLSRNPSLKETNRKRN